MHLMWILSPNSLLRLFLFFNFYWKKNKVQIQKTNIVFSKNCYNCRDHKLSSYQIYPSVFLCSKHVESACFSSYHPVLHYYCCTKFSNEKASVFLCSKHVETDWFSSQDPVSTLAVILPNLFSWQGVTMDQLGWCWVFSLL